jgi:hypothetical protein
MVKKCIEVRYCAFVYVSDRSHNPDSSADFWNIIHCEQLLGISRTEEQCCWAKTRGHRDSFAFRENEMLSTLDWDLKNSSDDFQGDFNSSHKPDNTIRCEPFVD